MIISMKNTWLNIILLLWWNIIKNVKYECRVILNFCFHFQINANDRDLGFNGDLLYVISDGDVDSVFRLDTSTGQLFVDGHLDRETTPEYTLNITVLDQVRFEFIS